MNNPKIIAHPLIINDKLIDNLEDPLAFGITSPGIPEAKEEGNVDSSAIGCDDDTTEIKVVLEVVKVEILSVSLELTLESVGRTPLLSEPEPVPVVIGVLTPVSVVMAEVTVLSVLDWVLTSTEFGVVAVVATLFELSLTPEDSITPDVEPEVELSWEPVMVSVPVANEDTSDESPDDGVE